MDALVRECQHRIQKGSKSFAGAALLLPADVRYDTYLLYAWCRYCDDLIDGQEFGRAPATMPATPGEYGDKPGERLQQLQRQTREALQGHASESVFLALQRVVQKHQIPDLHPMDHLEGFAMDTRQRKFIDLNDTLEYCYHVAGVVGVMMALIMGVRNRDVLNRASDLGIAFQLTNIARDVLDDAENGRIYLPQQWLEEHQIPPDNMTDDIYRQDLTLVVRRLLDEADKYYQSAEVGISHLPGRCALAIDSAKRIYSDIGTIVRRRQDRAWDERVYVSAPRKMVCVFSSLAASLARSKPREDAADFSRNELWTKS